jgi:hypothetical protein
VIDGQAIFVLPLVNHLVDESVTSLIVAIAPYVTAAHHDLRPIFAARRRIVAEARPHPPRYVDRYAPKFPPKQLLIELRMPFRESLRNPGVVAMCPVSRVYAGRTWRQVLRQAPSSLTAATAGTRSHEVDDCAKRWLRSLQVTFLHAQHSPAEAHEYGPVSRQAKVVDATQPHLPQPREQLIGRLQWTIERKSELCLVARRPARKWPEPHVIRVGRIDVPGQA